ncbi:cytochrome b5 [Cucumis melo var. makuwa]|uniref:Cytochrome b5 n=1 Tax=Cucumis melo var. makuwa TaxID=1194695 RepID=A0A5A7V8T8_CUCMM|nr:cytochrome b5 [Cucumis melo var. makuwa]
MPSISALYSIQEVSQHSSSDDCWIIIDGKVYDLTSYLDEHPGGDDIIVTATGRDATDDFEDAGHSKDARELMEKFYIGLLDTSSSDSLKLETNQVDSYATLVQTLTKQYWKAPVAVIGKFIGSQMEFDPTTLPLIPLQKNQTIQ